MSEGPIFIGGLDRSGKTYMRLMLASHPGFAISKRTNLWPRVYMKFGDLAQDAALDRCLEALADHKHIRDLELDFQRLRRDLETGPRSYERLFALIHEQYAERLGKSRWGDQTELLERYAAIILAAYPEAVFIHMLRDPRDRFEAVLDKSPHRRGGVGAATARWLYSAALADRNQKDFPLRYIVVRYETMVTQPEETMRHICNFLDETFHPAMLKMGDASRFVLQDTPLSTEYIGRFRSRLTAEEVTFIQKHAGRFMALFGYPLEPIRLSLPESAWFYTFHWSVNLAQMLGWRMRNLAER